MANLIGIIAAFVFIYFVSYQYVQIYLLTASRIRWKIGWYVYFGMVFVCLLLFLSINSVIMKSGAALGGMILAVNLFAGTVLAFSAAIFRQILKNYADTKMEADKIGEDSRETEKRAADAVQRFVDSNVDLHKKIAARENSRRAMINIMADLDTSMKKLELSEKMTRQLNEKLQADEKQLRSMTEELKRANEELERMNKLKTDFVSMVSHELKIPIAVIKEATAFLLMKDFNPEKKKRYTEIIARHVDKLNRLVSDLLDLSRIEAGRLVLKKEPLDLKKVIESAIVGLILGAESKGLKLKSTIEEDLPWVLGDEDRLTEVMNNLMGNSIKYTEKGGIMVDARRDGQTVKVTVSDTGIGIPQKDLDKVFEKFYRGDDSSARVAGGTGLGLAIAKGIIEVLGGKVWAESGGEGMGTSFIFTLPAI